MAPFSDIGGYYPLFPLFFMPLFYLTFKHFKASFVAKNTIPLPPGPTPWPVLGNIPHLCGKLPHVTLQNIAQTYGELIFLRLGTQNLVVASSPAAAIEILKTHDRTLSGRYIPESVPAKLIQANRSSLVWAETCHDEWKSLRALCRAELFSGNKLDVHSSLREKKLTEMVEYLGTINDGGVVNIGDLVFATVFNMLSNVFFSRDLIELNEVSVKGGIKDWMRRREEITTAPNISDFYPILSNFDLQGLRKKSKNLAAKMRAIWEPIIDERRRAGDALRQNDFLEVLIQQNFNNAQIHQLLLELFTGGSDTPSAIIEWTMTELIKSPKCMRKVQEELNYVFATNLVKESDLSQLPYLQACVKETLRLHPPPFLFHHASEACHVMKYMIPENAVVLVNVYAIGRDPSIWDEPLMFKPERFLHSAVDFRGNDFEFLPFGGGRRMCPGLPLATRLVPLVVAALLRSYDWTLPAGMDTQQLDMDEKFAVALHKENPLLLIPVPKHAK